MSVNKLLFIEKEEKAQLWEAFLYEKMLDDNEQILLDDLNRYEERIRDIGTANTPVEVNLLRMYMENIKNIRTLLLSLQNKRQEILKPQLEDLSINSSSGT